MPILDLTVGELFELDVILDDLVMDGYHSPDAIAILNKVRAARQPPTPAPVPNLWPSDLFEQPVAPPPGPTWKTGDGRTIAIADMDNQHIVNTVRFIERKFTEARPELKRSPMALDEMRKFLTREHRPYAAMMAEVEKRKLWAMLDPGRVVADAQKAAQAKVTANLPANLVESDAVQRFRLLEIDGDDWVDLHVEEKTEKKP